MPDNGVYISELTNTTNVTDDTLFITDDTENTYNIKASDVASYVSGKVLPEAESYSDDNKTAAVAEAKEYTDSVVSNPNLLINGDFQVWQRGKNFTGAGYTADRWRARSVSVSVLKLDTRGVRISSTSTNSVWWIQYFFEDQQIDNLRGKTITISAKIRKDRNFLCYLRGYFFTSSSISLNCSQVTDDWRIVSGTFTVDETEAIRDNGAYLGFVTDSGLNGTDWLEIEYVKLEIGSVATPLSPRPYAEELAMCQRYYYVMPINYSMTNVYADTNRVDFNYALPVEMRTTPTATFGPYMMRAINATGVTDLGTSFSLTVGSYLTKKVFYIKATKTKHGLSSNHVILRFSDNTTTLDAEIYS